MMWETIPLTTFFFFNDTATTEFYTLSLHDALPISPCREDCFFRARIRAARSQLPQTPPRPMTALPASSAPNLPPINAERLWRRVETLSTFTLPDVPWTRRAFSPEFDQARARSEERRV